MIKRFLTLYLITLSLFCWNPVSADQIRDAADQALMSGDMDLALELFMEVLESDPENIEVMQVIAMLAQESGIPELGVQMLQGQIELLVSRGDREAIAVVNDEVSALTSALPDWVTERLAAASRIDSDGEEIIAGYDEMHLEAESLMTAGDFESALAAQESALVLVTEMLGGGHWLTAAATRDLGFIYRQMGDAEAADAFYNEAIALATVSLGEEHPETIQIYELLAELYRAVGATDEALALSDMIVASLAESFGQSHELTVNARMNQIAGLEQSGQFEDARNLMEMVCELVDQDYGSWHPVVIDCLLQQARLASAADDIAAAGSYYQIAIQRMAESYTTVNSEVLLALTQSAEIYREQGEYLKARQLLASVIQTALQMGDSELGYLARSYLGRVFNNEGDLVRAQAITEQVLDYGLANWLDRPIDIYNTLLELGSVYQRQGKFAEAEASYRQALEGLMDVAGMQHPSTLVALNNLGQVFEEVGLYDQAEPLLKQALGSLEETLGVDSQQTSRARNNLALLYESQGNFREAEPLYTESLAILGETRGDDYTDTIAVKNNLAFLYMLMEEYDQSAELFEEVHAQWSQLFGDEHQFTMKALNNLGRIYQKQQKVDQATEIFVRALASRRSVLGESHPDVIRSMIDLGSAYVDADNLVQARTTLTAALALAEKVLGEQHPYTFEALNNLARLYRVEGNLDAAIELSGTGFQRRSQFLDRMLWVTGENAREGYVRLHRPEFDNYLAMLTKTDSSAGGRRALGASLQRKGLLLKVTSEIQQISQLAGDPALTAVANELETARKELAALTLSGPTIETQGRHAEALYDLEQSVNELQGELGRASVRYRSSIAQIDVDSLASVLPPGSALVDFLAYEEQGALRYLAGVVINDGSSIRFELVKFSNREQMEAAVLYYRQIIQDDQADEDELVEAGQTAYELVWQPVADLIEGIEYVYLIPDGVLNILPFNALVDPDEKYLIQTHDIHILTSGRDLLPNEYKVAKGEYVILAGPDYNSEDVVDKQVLAAARGRRSTTLQMDIRGAGGGLRGLNFAPLPGAEREGRIITNQVQETDSPSEVFFGADAQEQVLSNLKQPPEILHMATHGFFLKADDSLRKRLLKLQRGSDVHVPPPGDNPLLRAGLAFAGINTNAQFLGDIDTVNDGVLTALEVLDLNLSGTKLVVLSACETGLGEIHEGEGVYGLRRSFQEAGVAEVISSLWEVSDAGTQALMTSFYERVLSGQPAREALRDTQLDLMDSPEWGYPYIWSAFMIVGSYESSGITIQ